MNTRRQFLTQSAAAMAGVAFLPGLMAAERNAEKRIRIGTCVTGLEQARAAGLEGVEVRAGNPADRLEIANPEARAKYKEQMRQTGLPICSIMMGLLNSAPLASDPRGPAWLDQTIDAAKDLGARVILVAFFGAGDLLGPGDQVKEKEMDVVVERLKAAAPRAKDAGVILGIENLLNGEQNMRMLDRINHEAVQIYYDVYNTGTSKRHNVPADVKLLGSRIAQIHFKNGPKYLDEEKAKFEPIAAAIRDINYRGWIVLETSNPSKDPVADGKRNGDYLRSLFA